MGILLLMQRAESGAAEECNGWMVSVCDIVVVVVVIVDVLWMNWGV